MKLVEIQLESEAGTDDARTKEWPACALARITRLRSVPKSRAVA